MGTAVVVTLAVDTVVLVAVHRLDTAVVDTAVVVVAVVVVVEARRAEHGSE